MSESSELARERMSRAVRPVCHWRVSSRLLKERSRERRGPPLHSRDRQQATGASAAEPAAAAEAEEAKEEEEEELLLTLLLALLLLAALANTEVCWPRSRLSTVRSSTVQSCCFLLVEM
jgi:hypothetical protein